MMLEHSHGIRRYAWCGVVRMRTEGGKEKEGGVR